MSWKERSDVASLILEPAQAIFWDRFRVQGCALCLGSGGFGRFFSSLVQKGCYSNSSRDWTTYLFSWIPWWIKAGHQETKTFCSSSIKVFLYTLSYFYLIFHQITLFLSWLPMRILFFVAIDSFHCCCDDCSCT